MTSTPFDPGPADDAEAVEADGRWTLVLRRRLRHSRPVVWSALTDPGQIAAWAPYSTGPRPGPHGEAVLTMVDGSTTVDLPAHVVRAEPPPPARALFGATTCSAGSSRGRCRHAPDPAPHRRQQGLARPRPRPVGLCLAVARLR